MYVFSWSNWQKKVKSQTWIQLFWLSSNVLEKQFQINEGPLGL